MLRPPPSTTDFAGEVALLVDDIDEDARGLEECSCDDVITSEVPGVLEGLRGLEGDGGGSCASCTPPMSLASSIITLAKALRLMWRRPLLAARVARSAVMTSTRY